MKEILKDYLHTSIVINAFDEIISTDDYDNETILASNAKRHIEQYFDGRLVHVNSPDGDPQEETMERVSGTEYIEYMFGNDYDVALEEIINEI
jgi:hypothetical protein